MHRTLVRPFGLRRLVAPAVLMSLLLAATPSHAAGPGTVKPWTPPADSLTRLAASARLRFQRQKGDSVVGDNFDGYEIVGDMGRKLLATLGRHGLAQAPAVEATLDSLGLDVEVRTDPQMKDMAFMLVRNPFVRSSDAVGYLYWLRGPELRMQGASYPPSQDFSVRFWWTGNANAPYEAVTLYRRRTVDQLAMRLYRMNETGVLWNLVQYEGNAPELGARTTAAFADVNNDGIPEIVAYHTAEPDTFMRIATDAPQLVQEYIYTERPEGFVLHDMRELPGPSGTVNMFATLLVRHEPDLARRLLLEPAHLDSVLALGWGQHHGRGDWNIEYGESQPWPEWLELRIRQDTGWKRWIFHFWIKDGRWVIRDWIPVQPASPAVDTRPDPLPHPHPPAAPKGKGR
jgi:hypothetical protein